MVVEEEANWSDLPWNLLHLIMDKLTLGCFMSDYVHVGCVCVSWSSAFHHNTYPRQSPPLLIVPPSLNIQQSPLRKFYDISNKKVHDMLEVRMPYYRHCCGSSHGWLITVDDDDEKSFSVRLFNPFLLSSFSPCSSSIDNNINHGMEIIVLPSLKDFPVETQYDIKDYSFLRRAVLSADPISNSTTYTVMAIYGCSSRLAFFKPTLKAWIPIKLPSIEGYREGGFEDVIYYQGKFFVVHLNGMVVVCDDVAATSKVLFHAPKEEDDGDDDDEPEHAKRHPYFTKIYLVESSQGNLLQVVREIEMDMTLDDKQSVTYLTVGFKVFKLTLAVQDHSTEELHEERRGLPEDGYEWIRVLNLCGDTMFLGQNASMSIPASNVYPGCRSNTIYYTDDSDNYVSNQEDGPHDMGVFNLEDNSFERHFAIDPKNFPIDPEKISQASAASNRPPTYFSGVQELGSYTSERLGPIVPIWPVPIWIRPSLPKNNINNNNNNNNRSRN